MAFTETAPLGGEDYHVLIFTDPNGGSPSDATQVWDSGDLTTQYPIVPDWDWAEFDVTADMADKPLSEGVWVIAVVNNAGNIWDGTDTNAADDPNSWSYSAMGGIWQTLAGYGGAGTGTFMFRATAYYF